LLIIDVFKISPQNLIIPYKELHVFENFGMFVVVVEWAA